MNDAAHEMVHKIDRRASGEITLSEIVTNPHSRNRYVVSSLIEEAITSSQLEGASTTRQNAKEMIRSGRPPRNRSERMILSNYRAMEFVGSIRDLELTPELVCEIHRRVTLDNLKDPADAGRLQSPQEDRIEVVWDNGTVLHVPPPAEQLPARLKELCRFANGGGPQRLPASCGSFCAAAFLARVRPSIRRWERQNRAGHLLLVDAPSRLLAG